MRAHSTIEDALTNGTGIERTFHCGNPDHHDRNASASVNSLTGAFICYACGWAGRVDVENFEIDVSEVGKQLTKLVTSLEEPPRVLSESWLSQYDASGPGEYWLSRFEEETCKHFRLGMDYEINAATIPVRDLAGTPLGVVKRDLTGEKQKYRYPPGSKVSETLFNYTDCQDDYLVLVEGATDAIAAWEVGHDGMAIYGANMSKTQQVAISKYNPKGILLCFDQDEAGERAARAAQAVFPEYPTYRPQWTHYKDLASMPIRRRKLILDDAKKILSELAQTSS